MTEWYAGKRHFRALRDRLLGEGFTVLDAEMSRHLRVRIERDGKQVTITCGCSPSIPEHAVDTAMQQARRGVT